MSIKVPAAWPTKDPIPLAFVGEAPGYEEQVALRPFVGSAGKVFDQMLRAANVDREQCLVTNLFDEKAPNNEVRPWLKDEGRVAEAEARLAEELERYKPNVVVAMGYSALWAFNRASAIGPYRGTVFKADRILPGVKVAPTWHPAAVARDWKMLPVTVADIIRAEAASRTPDLLVPDKTLWLEPSIDDVYTWVANGLNAERLSVDIETGWGMITCIGWSWDKDNACCVPFTDLRRANRSYWQQAWQELDVWRAVETLLGSSVPKVGQNFPYDAMWLLKKRGIEVHNYRDDTRLMSHALFPELPKSLEFLTANYTNIGPYKYMAGRFEKEKRDA